MSSPKIICKSAYTKNIEHIFNSLEYSGNAIASQTVIFKDGSTLEVSADKKIYFPEAELSTVDKINIGFKDGGSKNISYETYRKIIEQTQKVVTVNDLVAVTGDFSNDELDFLNLTGEKPYRELMDMDIFKYMDYFSHRQGVVKSADGHGLFGVTGDINIEDAKALALEHINSIKWLHILSLPEGEDVRTGFDRRDMWQALISSEAPRIAKLYNISLENLVINAGLHKNTENTHCHLVVYSKNQKEGYIKGTEKMINASEHLKSIFVNKIFKDDISALNTDKSAVRDEIKSSLDRYLKNINETPMYSKEIYDKFLELADIIKREHDPKKKSSYGYMRAEYKVLVDDLLRCIITSDNNMKNLYDKFLDIQTKYIRNYTSDPIKVEKRLDNFERRFFAPKRKDDTDKSYHNLIFRAVQEFNKLPAPSEPVRTAEGETWDFSPNDDSLSSLLNSEPPTEKASSFSGEYDEAIFVRTAEEKTSDFNPDNHDLSSAKTKQSHVEGEGIERINFKEYDSSNYKEMSEYLRDKADCINFSSLSKVYRKSIDGIFNPKIFHTDWQLSLSDRLLELHSELSNDKPETISKVNETFDLINTIDPQFRDCIDILVDNTFDELTEKLGENSATKYVNSFFSSLDNPSKLGACKSYIYYLAENVHDQQYYQLLQAYKELGSPLNKAMYKAVNDMDIVKDRDLLSSLRAIKNINDDKKYFDSKELMASYSDNIRCVLGQLNKKTEVNNSLNTLIADYSKVFEENFDTAHATHYAKIFSNNLLSAKRLMRPHYSIINFADNIDDIVANKIIYQFKKPLNDVLIKKLTECLCDTENSFSSAFILEKLKSIRDFDKPECACEILKYIYETDFSFRKDIDNNIEICYTALKKEFDTNKAQELIKNYKNSFFSADVRNPFSQTVKYFAKAQLERTYSKILKEHKELFEPMQIFVKSLLLNALKPHNSSMKVNTLLDELATKIEELTKLKKIEKPNETIKEAIKENLKLQAKLRSEILKQFDKTTLDKAVNECTSKFDELFQKLCEPNDALTLSGRLKSDIYSGESIISSNYTMQFYAENAKHIRQSNINYQNAMAIKFVGRIMRLIATSLNSHANYLNQENNKKDKLENALRASKQFKTKKFDRGGFTSENEISY